MRINAINTALVFRHIATWGLVTLLAACANAQTPVLHWAFDVEGSIVQDSSPVEPKADGMLQPTATFTTDTPGGFSPLALDLTAEGLESWVNGGDATKIDTLESFTLTTWVKLADWNTGGSNNQRLYAKQGGGPNYDGISWNIISPEVGDPAPDNFRLGLFIGAAGVDGDAPTFVAGTSEDQFDFDLSEKWYFLAATYDGTNEDGENAMFYLGDEEGGVIELGDPLTMLGGAVASTSGQATANIGLTDAAADADTSVNGFQDDFRIYDQVLTLEELETVRLANLEGDTPGDFDGDGELGLADIDELTAAILAGDTSARYDLNGDSEVTIEDRTMWIKDLKFTWIGDANLDGEFGSTDLVEAFTFGLYETGEAATWASGDFDGDGSFNSSDFVSAFSDGGYENGPRTAVAAVPEPSTMMLSVMSLALFAVWRRR